MPRQVVFHELGGAEVLKLEEQPPAEPGPGEIRVAVAAIGLCALAAGYALADGKDGGVTVDRSTVPGGFNGNLDYTGGPNVCGQCHPQAFDDWMAHGHSGKLALAFELGIGAPACWLTWRTLLRLHLCDEVHNHNDNDKYGGTTKIEWHRPDNSQNIR